MPLDKLVSRTALISAAATIGAFSMLIGCTEEGLRNYTTFENNGNPIAKVANYEGDEWSFRHYPEPNTCVLDTPWNYGSNDHLPREFSKNTRIPTDENPLPVFDRIINEGCRGNLSGWNFVRMLDGKIFSNPGLYPNGTELSEKIASYFSIDSETTQFAPPLDSNLAELVSQDRNSVQQALNLKLFFLHYF